ncbi:hypothetical protein BXT86_02945 [candidate division WOR-3 bacterium 4484_100]|uniref:Uncharacterized protein n=1 Tax=candidate division WOR-3 bacterium 4484_100 TaxID=1936077 RepID=A0A1V4QGI4_UNCW3|nr:MAG: hypothetical protein BXT86_02945 [candidate division WOR-3 bacterium 4484_100]
MHLILIFFLLNDSLHLLPNDAVGIELWRQPDLSGKYYVDVDTSLNIPLFGKFSIKNIGIDSLRSLLMEKFHNYYGDIFVDIDFYFRINIFGEVKNPGFYYVKSEDNLANLLAQAGGPTERGSLNRIRILNIGTERVVNFEKILKSGKHTEALALRPGDVVIVPRRFMPALQEWSVLLTLGTLLLQIYYAVAK